MVDETDRAFGELKTNLGSAALNKLKELRISIENQNEENNKLQSTIKELQKDEYGIGEMLGGSHPVFAAVSGENIK